VYNAKKCGDAREYIMTNLGILQAIAGKHIPAIQQIKLYSAEEWEKFVEEWLTTKKDNYIEIENLGGAGDQGRDVVGFLSNPKAKNYRWDNYQCKHYDHALMPSDVWIEFGKLIYFTFKEEFPVPQRFYFVAPYGVGTSLSNLLRKPEKLRKNLIKNWVNHCQDKISKKVKVFLDGELLNYLNKFDFSIFEKITPLTLIQEHKTTEFYISRFGGGIPPRPKTVPAPSSIQSFELPYIKQLLKAYSSDCNKEMKKVDQLNSEKKYQNHFNRARENFHQAEQLKMFSRDKLPPDTFNKLKDEIFSGIIDIIEDEFPNGFLRVKSAEQEARRLAITSNPLCLCCTLNDRSGVCHHLANEGKVFWTNDE
jgi:hypothetical protein